MEIEQIFKQIHNKMQEGYSFETYYCDIHRKIYLIVCETIAGSFKKKNCNFFEGSSLIDCYRNYIKRSNI